MTIEQKLCEELKISLATLKNWQKEKLIPPLPSENEGNYTEFLEQIRQNTKNKLISRANRTLSSKKQIIFHGITSPERKKLLCNLIQAYEKSGLSVEQAVSALCYRCLVCEKLWDNSLQSLPSFYSVFDSFFIPNEDDDLIGAFYQSVLSLSKKSGSGSFYTPQSLLKDIYIPSDKSIYDPCCGSGNILLKVLSKEHKPELIFASDIDELALKICRVNLAMFFHDSNLKANIFKRDFLDADFSIRNFDFIITNPPWGAGFSARKRLELKEKYPELNTSESFSICLYNAFLQLSDRGLLHFFLPKSFLNVSKHRKIRQFLLEQDCSLKIRDFGNAFKGVVSQTILLTVEKNKEKEKLSTSEILATSGTLTTSETSATSGVIAVSCGTIPKSSILPPDYFIPLLPPDKLFINKKLLESFPYITLKNNAVFGMGIVTGNNSVIFGPQNAATTENAEKEKSPLYRGKNIQPYHLTESNLTISFEKEKFQQSAPEELYRQKKIVYRFIANHPVCCLDEKGELFLNSANFFIPSPALDYPWESIICLFNSSLYEEYYKNTFASIKILRSHIEKLPLFLFTPDQHRQLKELYDKASNSLQSTKEIQSQIDDLLRQFLQLHS